MVLISLRASPISSFDRSYFLGRPRPLIGGIDGVDGVLIGQKIIKEDNSLIIYITFSNDSIECEQEFIVIGTDRVGKEFNWIHNGGGLGWERLLISLETFFSLLDKHPTFVVDNVDKRCRCF